MAALVTYIVGFQSSPGPKAGRYIRRPGLAGRAATGFNPRPARRPGATGAAATWQAQRLGAFQSSPGPKAGRYMAAAHSPYTRRRWFQSSPGPKAGRYRRNQVRDVAVHPVSILARPEGRALLHPAGDWECLIWGFNPRPARRPGATGRQPARVRPVRRGFNPRPARRPGATRTNTRPAGRYAVFQSSPGPKAGRYRDVRDVRAAHSGFQSSPGPKAGRY